MYNYSPVKMAMQRFMFEILKDKYASHQHIIERMGHYLVTEQDVKEFSALIIDVYQNAFHKATTEYTQKLAEQGFEIKD